MVVSLPLQCLSFSNSVFYQSFFNTTGGNYVALFWKCYINNSLQRMVDLDFHLTNNIICSKCRDPRGILPIKT